MTETLVVRPGLAARVAAGQSRTEAFSARHFGAPGGGVALELALPGVLNASQYIAAEVFVELCLRMDPVVSELRLVRTSQTCQLINEAATRVPLQVSADIDQRLPSISFGVGPTQATYVDASDWHAGFDTPAPGTNGNSPAGAFLAGLEGAKHVYLCAIEASRNVRLDQAVWPGRAVFDAWRWAWSEDVLDLGLRDADYDKQANIALVGCGGVGAGYLWFLRKSFLRGNLVLIDPDLIAWHNMNRLPFATIADADSARAKVLSAADFMRGRWSVQAFARHAEHDEAIEVLRGSANSGGLLASAVGEPETRKFLARRGFASIFDAATNSDGSVQLLSLKSGVSSCLECHVRPRSSVGEPMRCDVAQTQAFAGVVPHLAAYAGALLALEHFRVVLGAEPLRGANTQSVLLPLEAATRLATRPCKACFSVRS